MALIGITVVVASLAVVVHIGGASLRERDLEYQAREQALEKSLAKEEARAAELEEYRVYVQTKQYIEKVAKEKLGLVNKDEILFKWGCGYRGSCWKGSPSWLCWPFRLLKYGNPTNISRLPAYNKMAYSAPLKLVMEIGTVFVTGYAG